MAEEPKTTPTITSDDMSALWVLLHTIKGLNVVSTAPEYVPDETVADSQTDD